VLYKIRCILWIITLLGACDVIQDGRHFGRHLGFYRKLEIIKKRLNLEIFNVGHAEYDIIKHLAAFCSHFFCILGEKHEFFKNGFTTCYLWRHIS